MNSYRKELHTMLQQALQTHREQYEKDLEQLIGDMPQAIEIIVARYRNGEFDKIDFRDYRDAIVNACFECHVRLVKLRNNHNHTQNNNNGATKD